MSRIDLHVHSRHSKSAGDWLLTTLRVRESYSEPRQIYDLARRRGMDFVTLTDHDTIDGALEIAHLPGVFISEEITTWIPESGAKLHVIALNINEAVHRDIQPLRRNVYELVEYLRQHRIVHFIAHPFLRMSERLAIDDVEKMILLFNLFEVKNGGKLLQPDSLLEQILDALTPETLWRLSDKHRIEAYGPHPWQKGHVAGSDDHGGILIGSPHTVCPYSASVEALLQHIERRESRAFGHGGSQLTVAHSILAVAYHHVREQGIGRTSQGAALTLNLLGQVFNTLDAERSLSMAARFALFLNSHVSLSNWIDPKKPLLRTIAADWLSLLRQHKQLQSWLRGHIDFTHDQHEQLFQWHNKLFSRSAAQIIDRANHPASPSPSSWQDHLSAVAVLIPLALPYIIAMKTEVRDRPLMRQAKAAFLHDSSSPKHLLALTSRSADRLADAASLCHFLQEEIGQCSQIEIWGADEMPAIYPFTYNFMPVNRYKPAGHNGKGVPIPSLVDFSRRLVDTDADVLYVHSLDVMGVLGILAGYWLHLPVICRYPYEGLRLLLHPGHDHNKNRFLQYALAFLLNLCETVRVTSSAAAAHARLLGVADAKLVLLPAKQPTSPPWSASVGAVLE
jgi:hypothetical protein